MFQPENTLGFSPQSSIFCMNGIRLRIEESFFENSFDLSPAKSIEQALCHLLGLIICDYMLLMRCCAMTGELCMLKPVVVMCVGFCAKPDCSESIIVRRLEDDQRTLH